MLAIGLTGGIGSGKTRVSDLLGAWGASVVDTDAIAHDVTAAGGPAMASLAQAFGPQALRADGAMDRDWMRARVFEDAAARATLESIVHPLIAQETDRRAAQATGAYLVFVVPLLIESGRWVSHVDRVCVVDCEPETQVQRVQQRSGLTPDLIRRIMAAQVDRATRLAAAHDIVFNGADVTPQQLESAVRAQHHRWLQMP